MIFNSIKDVMNYYFPNFRNNKEKSLEEIGNIILKKFKEDVKNILKEVNIKPCKCGSGEIKVSEYSSFDKTKVSYICECENGHRGEEFFATRQGAIDDWNKEDEESNEDDF